jgi:hypothetical protein
MILHSVRFLWSRHLLWAPLGLNLIASRSVDFQTGPRICGEGKLNGGGACPYAANAATIFVLPIALASLSAMSRCVG